MMAETGTAVLLIGHGSSFHDSAAGCLSRHAETLRQCGVFTNVQHATLNGGQDPLDAFAKVNNAGRIMVLPYFMTDGYLSRLATTCRLGEHADDHKLVVCSPIGLSDGLVSLVANVAEETRQSNEWHEKQWDVLLVAHGSSKNPASRQGTEKIAQSLNGQTSAKNIRTCFIEETPFVQDVAKTLNQPTAVIGLFAAPGGHALDDVPEALRNAQVPVPYSGAIGDDPRMVDVIMVALEAEMQDVAVAS